MDIPLDVEVYGHDGRVGRSTHIVVNPVTDEVTHVVVRDNTTHHTLRLVPIKLFQESDTDMIRLDCNSFELAEMNVFEDVEFIPTTVPHVEASAPPNGYAWPYIIANQEPHYVEVVHRHIPPYERDIRRGAHVHATDGRVGQVDEVVVDSKTFHLTHLVLREGHLWGKKDVMIPVDEIENITENNIYLKSDKQTVEKLPTFPVHRHVQL